MRNQTKLEFLWLFVYLVPLSILIMIPLLLVSKNNIELETVTEQLRERTINTPKEFITVYMDEKGWYVVPPMSMASLAKQAGVQGDMAFDTIPVGYEWEGQIQY